MTARHGWTPVTAPGPTGGEMLRGFGTIRRDPLQFLADSWRNYGDVVQFPIPVPPTYLVSSPAGVRRVLQQNHRGYGKATVQYRNLALVTGPGLLAADTEAWRTQRKAVQPAFHPRAVVSVVEHTAAAADRLGDQWQRLQPGVEVDVDEAMMRTALEIVGAALFGADLREESAELVAATQDGLHAVVARTRNPLSPPLPIPTPGNVRLRSAVRRLDKAVADIVARRRRQTPAAQPADMLDVLLADGTLSPAQLRDQVVTFIVAGHETVASALSWAWYLLGAHPEVADQLAAESEAVLGPCLPTFDDLPQLRWASAVFDEAMRLYPPGWLITRKALAPDTVDGHEIPAGALVLISPYLVHRHPEANVGEQPEVFEPRRFLEGVPSPATGLYIPFGAGPRLCIGREMARAEGAVVLSVLARRFRLLPRPGHVVVKNPEVMLKPRGGLPMSIAPRPATTSAVMEG